MVHHKRRDKDEEFKEEYEYLAEPRDKQLQQRFNFIPYQSTEDNKTNSINSSRTESSLKLLVKRVDVIVLLQSNVFMSLANNNTIANNN